MNSNTSPLKEATGTNYGILNLSNEHISIDLCVESNGTFIKQIKNVSQNTDFLSANSGDLWTLSCKKDKEYISDYIIITPAMAEKIFVDKSDTKITITWKNAKAPEMVSGFDITCSCEIKDENSYWDAYISANKEYGIWDFEYPKVYLNPIEGDQLLWPKRGGRLYTEFDNPKGLEDVHPRFHGDYLKKLEIFTPGNMQVVSLIKGETSLYLCQEDPDCNLKVLSLEQIENNNFLYNPKLYAPHIGQAGYDYRQAYPHNLAVVKGDWYNVLKKYRKWGIANNYGVFANGRLEDRTNLPDWYKYNNVWFLWFLRDNKETVESIIKSQEYLDMPVICHSYLHSIYDFDTHYPNWCPIKDFVVPQFEEIKKHNMHIMPYTNGHLVDMNLSEYYKEYGDELVAKDEKGDIYYEAFAVEQGAKDVAGCIGGAYHDVFKGELKKLLKATDYDAIYIDQLGACDFYPCFNELHNHTHGGDFWAKGYRSLINKAREELYEEKGEYIPFTTEDSNDYCPFDGWLRINDGEPNLMPNSGNMFVYSDYVVNFGVFYRMDTGLEKDEITYLNKTAINLTEGYQMGWQTAQNNEFDTYPNFAKYFKSACKAREAFVKYFNFGEMVRPVKMANIPTMNLYYMFHNCEPGCKGYYDFPYVRTCSYNYNGKTLLCFANISDESVKIDFSCKAEDLNLENKNSYNINISWSKDKALNNKLESKGECGTVASNFTIDGKDIVMILID